MSHVKIHYKGPAYFREKKSFLFHRYEDTKLVFVKISEDDRKTKISRGGRIDFSFFRNADFTDRYGRLECCSHNPHSAKRGFNLPKDVKVTKTDAANDTQSSFVFQWNDRETLVIEYCEKYSEFFNGLNIE